MSAQNFVEPALPILRLAKADRQMRCSHLFHLVFHSLSFYLFPEVFVFCNVNILRVAVLLSHYSCLLSRALILTGTFLHVLHIADLLIHSLISSLSIRAGWGKMSMMEQRSSLDIFIRIPKVREPIVIRSTLLFFNYNRKSKADDPVIISSLTVTLETKKSSD